MRVHSNSSDGSATSTRGNKLLLPRPAANVSTVGKRHALGYADKFPADHLRSLELRNGSKLGRTSLRTGEL